MQSTKPEHAAPEIAEETEQEAGSAAEAEAAPDPALEETKKMIAQWAQRGHKPLLFDPPLSAQSARTLEMGIAQLSELKAKIAKIRTEVNNQHEHITGRLSQLKDNPVIQIDSENKQASESVTQYSALLDRIVEEVDFESTQLQRFAALEAQTALPVPFHAPDNFDNYIKNTVTRVKKQIKKIHRDLDVSFSRYSFSFDKQCKNLLNIESLVSYNMKMREHQEKTAAEKQVPDATPTPE